MEITKIEITKKTEEIHIIEEERISHRSTKNETKLSMLEDRLKQQIANNPSGRLDYQLINEI